MSFLSVRPRDQRSLKNSSTSSYRLSGVKQFDFQDRSDDVRVIDASDPTNPKEVAYFVPPAGQNPVKPSQRGVLSNTTQVWGVYVDEATGSCMRAT